MTRPLVTAFCLLALASCGGDPPPPQPAAAPVVNLPTPDDLLRITRDAERRSLARTQLQRGFACGWHSAWMGAVVAQREVAPRTFRGDAVASAFGWGFVAMCVGFGGVFILAWLLPRMRRRPKKPDPNAEPRTSWPAYFKDLLARTVARVGRLLRVEQFDPLLASERQRAIESCRDIERQLALTLEKTPTLGADRPERAAAFTSSLETWRAETVALRRRLEGPGTLPRELSPDRIGPRVEVLTRAARDLRLRVERYATLSQLGALDPSPAAIDGRWSGLDKELEQRPDTPRDRLEVLAAELPPWVRMAGLGGLAGVALGLPMMAAWMAAGAFPLFFALLFSLGGLVALLVARVHLHRAGRLPLLPGFADRVASWLAGVCAIVLLVVIGSSWMSAESGLDLGDPPPVSQPDPQLTEAPLIWKDVVLYPPRPTSPRAPTTPPPATAPTPATPPSTPAPTPPTP